ncbi:hypothetical protein GCM10009716_22870 [Streptomyces sodiiphilus]|uniref:Uncharacterized protein n=1 Tax=Streptomyces sodiiphilus TaxID=226217 RepID=A0ABN2P8K2_9ACTN
MQPASCSSAKVPAPSPESRGREAIAGGFGECCHTHWARDAELVKDGLELEAVGDTDTHVPVGDALRRSVLCPSVFRGVRSDWGAESLFPGKAGAPAGPSAYLRRHGDPRRH